MRHDREEPPGRSEELVPVVEELDRVRAASTAAEMRHRTGNGVRKDSLERGGPHDVEGAGGCEGGGLDVATLHNFWHRAFWLVMLLMCQSTSSLILEHFQVLLSSHPVVIYFLTMLVGAGGNAGGQSTVLVVRKLAVTAAQCAKGSRDPEHRLSVRRIVGAEISVGARLALVLFFAAFLRCVVFQVRGQECLAICLSMLVIVFTSTLIGAALPLLLSRLRIDPAHAGATIQVIMDISGVTLTCVVSCLVLGLPVNGSLKVASNATAARNASASAAATTAVLAARSFAPLPAPIRLGSEQDLNAFGSHNQALHPDIGA